MEPWSPELLEGHDLKGGTLEPSSYHGLGLASGAYFLHDFSIERFNTLSVDKVSMSYLFLLKM